MTLRQRSLTSLLFVCGGVALAATQWPTMLPGICVFRRVTGIPCPTCGMTRASCALAHGQFHEALNYHIAVVPFAICVILAIVLLVLELITNRPHVALTWRRSARVVLFAFLVTVLVGWYFNLRPLWQG